MLPYHAVPEVHLTRMHCDTVFDRSFTDAALTVHLSFAGAPDEVRLQLEKADGSRIQLGTIKTETDKEIDFSVWVKHPEKWIVNIPIYISLLRN